MSTLHRSLAGGNSGPFAFRPEPGRPRPTSLDAILSDPDYSDAAKLLARNLDGRCLAVGKWAAWPSVPTVAADLGWDSTEHGGRKKVQRAFAELIAGGALGRGKLRELVDWFDAEGTALGLGWPKQLARRLRPSAMVNVLWWRVAPAADNPPILPACDILVAPDVAPTATEMSALSQRQRTARCTVRTVCLAKPSPVEAQETCSQAVSAHVLLLRPPLKLSGFVRPP